MDMRHGTTHGQMQRLTVLGAVVKCRRAWLDVHYWVADWRGQVVAGMQEEEVHPDSLVLVITIGKC